MLLKILAVLAVLVAGLLIVAALQPAAFRITRRISILAPPAVVFGQVNDLHHWQAWSPWAKMDPTAQMTYDGPPAGTGAAYTWAGNREVGEGRMTIIESQPSDRVRFRLEFQKPFAATHLAEFTFQPEGEKTLVEWSMTGTNAFIFRVAGLFINCDKMVGGQFEKGLADLKTLAEAEAKQ